MAVNKLALKTPKLTGDFCLIDRRQATLQRQLDMVEAFAVLGGGWWLSQSGWCFAGWALTDI